MVANNPFTVCASWLMCVSSSVAPSVRRRRRQLLATLMGVGATVLYGAYELAVVLPRWNEVRNDVVGPGMNAALRLGRNDVVGLGMNAALGRG